MKASVVVPTCKRPDLLKRCLSALLAQDFPAADYEVIIVDDATCDETRQLVARCARQAGRRGQTVRYLPMTGNCRRRGPAAARNMGWQAARGEIIAFTDDDCIPCVEWLKAGVAAFTGDVVGVSGRVIVPLPPTPTDYELDASHLEESEFVTANCFYRRDALLMLGGFDERFTIPWREDSDLFFSLMERRACLAYAPAATVVHPVRPAHWGISVRQQRKSMFNALLYKKHPALYRERIQSAPPWHYYGSVGALLLSLIGLSRRSRSIAIGGICLWAYFSGRFCAQRLKHTSHAPEHVVEMLITSTVIPPLAIFWRVAGMLKFRVFFL